MNMDKNDIAVIGIGCRFPDADRSDTFYENLLANKDSVQEVPKERWSYSGLYSTDGEKNRIGSKWGGFISGVNEFDPRFFKILPSEAELLDPQQKLFLTCSWETLEDAGYARRKATAGKQVGVYAGVTWNEFSLYANEYGYLRDEYKGAGSLYWGIPNRVSYFFDFIGPSIAIDTACSSSLVAVHLASQGLISGECEMALAGGVNLNLHPAKYLFLSSSNFLSSEGKCRGFGEGGDGYVPSEGVGVLVLKTLSSAVEAGDRIYGVIKATATNHGGKATGYTVPNPRAHKEVIKSALNRAKVTPREIGYVECHGTGTDLGDPIEITGLKLAFEESTQDRQFCGIGTVKSNIGHCEAAAGVAGLIKVLLSMRSETIPATLHAEIPNRKIDFEKSPFYLVRENTPWKAGNGRLLAGLSSFGAGGSNCHCILQSFKEKRVRARKVTVAPHVIPISAANPDRVAAYCRELKEFLQKDDKVSLTDLCYTLKQRETFEHRTAFLADSKKTLIQLLDLYADTRPDGKVHISVGLTPGAQVTDLKDWAEAWTDDRADLRELAVAGEGELVTLPTYAFEKSHSWIDSSRYLYQKRVDTGSALHPLVDTNASTVSCGVFNKRLRRNEYFVDEHWVQDNPVLPGVCLVEMAMFSAQTYLESTQLSLSDIWFLEPIALRDIESVDIWAEISSPGTDPRFEILTNGGAVKHATGKVRVGRSGHESPSTIDVDKVLSRCGNSIPRDEFYARFATSGIVQTGRFKVVSEFRFNESEAITRLTLSDNFSNHDHYGLNPTLMDGAIQTAMAHLFQQLPQIKTVLPFQIGACIRHRPLESTVYAIALLKSLDSKKYDILICDQSGNPLVELRDFVLKEYKEKQRKERPLMFSPVFKEHALPESSADVSSDTAPVCLLTSPEAAFITQENTPPHWSHMPWGEVTSNGDAADFRTGGGADGNSRIAVIIERTGDGDTGGDLFQAVKAEAKKLFDFAQSLVKGNYSADVIVCVLDSTSAGGAFAQACLGLIKCLNLEFSKTRFRLLEADQVGESRDLLAWISAEFDSDLHDVYIRYENDKRIVHELHAVTPETSSFDSAKEPSAWMVTGAGGSLGMIVSRHLLKRGHRVILLGRSPLSDSKRASLEALSKESWEYIQCDLTREQQVKEAVTYATDRFDDVWGIVHCAGTLEDGAFLQKEWSVFERVIETKIKSLLLLCGNLSRQDVRRIILFSSLTSLMGNKGQSDYAFANGFLDGFSAVAEALFPNSKPVVSSLNWPYWAEGGMKISENKLPAYIETFLTRPLSTESGLQVFDAISAAGSVRAGVVYPTAEVGDLERKLLLKRLSRHEAHNEKESPQVHVPSASIEAGEPEEKKRAIQQYLFRFLERELKLDLTEDDLQIKFSELGVDSIAQMDLITKLEKQRRFQNIPQTLLVDNTNIATLTDFFYENHRHADYSLN